MKLCKCGILHAQDKCPKCASTTYRNCNDGKVDERETDDFVDMLCKMMGLDPRLKPTP